MFVPAGLLGADNAWDPEGPRKPLLSAARGQARRACYLRVLAHVAGQVQGSREVGVLHIRRQDSRREGAHSLRDVIAGTGLADAGPAGCQPGDAQAG